MFSSRMCSKRGHRISSSVSQYLGGAGGKHGFGRGGGVPCGILGFLWDLGGGGGLVLRFPTHLSTAGMLRLAMMALKRRTMWMQRKTAMLS